MSHPMKSNRGFRPDLGFWCDSNHEANIARILKHLEIEFEPYDKSKRIIIQELGFTNEDTGRPLKWMEPDFYLPKEDRFIEVKAGWNSVASNDRKKLAAALLLNKKIVEICGITYKILEEAFKSKIREWES